MLFVSLEFEVHQIGLTSILDFWYPGPSYLMQKSLYFTFFFVFSVLYTKKMRWREHSLADTVPLFSTIVQFSSEVTKNWGTVCPVYTLYEIIVLANSIRILYFHVCFLSFLLLFTIVASWIVLIIQTSLVVPHSHHYVTIPLEHWLPFFQAHAFPF